MHNAGSYYFPMSAHGLCVASWLGPLLFPFQFFIQNVFGMVMSMKFCCWKPCALQLTAEASIEWIGSAYSDNELLRPIYWWLTNKKILQQYTK